MPLTGAGWHWLVELGSNGQHYKVRLVEAGWTWFALVSVCWHLLDQCELTFNTINTFNPFE